MKTVALLPKHIKFSKCFLSLFTTARFAGQKGCGQHMAIKDGGGGGDAYNSEL
jgi:hypothetical protein